MIELRSFPQHRAVDKSAAHEAQSQSPQPAATERKAMATLSMQQMAQQLAEMQAAVAKLSAENAQLKAAPMAKLTLKVSEKGAVSLYGLGRFPVTLYGEQWARVIDKAAEIKAFIDAHRSELATKADAVAASAASAAVAVNTGKAAF